MRAVLMLGYGSTDVLRVSDVPDPMPGPGEVLVDVVAASINAADYKVRMGSIRYDDMSFPHILGRDFSGVVAASSPEDDLEVGDEVFGVCVRGKDGGYAEKIAIASAMVARKPRELEHVTAAAIALVGITAIYALEDVGSVRPGQRVLVQGGAGGVGSIAVQLAKHLGASVTTTTSAGNADYARSLGADEVIDYHGADFTSSSVEYDLVYDTVGGDVQRRSASVVKSGGVLVTCVPGPELESPSRDDIRVEHPAVHRDRAHLERIAELVTSGAVQVPTITRFPLEAAAEAHRISESRHLQGKLVLETRPLESRSAAR